jgi:hypothetical protein
VPDLTDRFGFKEPPEILPDEHLDDWSPGELVEAFGK